MFEGGGWIVGGDSIGEGYIYIYRLSDFDFSFQDLGFMVLVFFGVLDDDPQWEAYVQMAATNQKQMLSYFDIYMVVS